MMFNIKEESGSIIKVIGVGGGGGNAVAHMFRQGIIGVDFAICNTDNQALDMSPVNTRIQLGPTLTEGRGAGSKPNIGRESCLESLEEIRKFLDEDTKMLFVTAGMGGGTGTGAAPIIAKCAQEMDILTVGIVTLPFSFEGRRRQRQAIEGLEEFKKNVDTLIVISNDKLREKYGNQKLSEAFSNADDILTIAAKGIAEIITVAGYINVDFEDVNTVMRGSGVAIMGVAEAEGENRAQIAVENALNSPLLEESDIRGAQHILLNISSGKNEVTMDEIFEITEFIQEEAGYGTDLIWGNCHDETLGDALSVTLIATGFEPGKERKVAKPAEKVTKVSLDDTHGESEGNGNIFNIGFNEGEKEQSVEFDTKSFNHVSSDEPYVKMDTEFSNPEVGSYLTQEQREERLRLQNGNLVNNNNVNDLENEPAYVRKKIYLENNSESSSESMLSKSTIEFNENGPEISDNNSYLHDNVD